MFSVTMISVTMGFKIIKILTLSKSFSASFIYGMGMSRLMKSICMTLAYKVKDKWKNRQRIQQQNLTLSQYPQFDVGSFACTSFLTTPLSSLPNSQTLVEQDSDFKTDFKQQLLLCLILLVAVIMVIRKVMTVDNKSR